MKGLVEKKVSWATLGSFGIGVGITLLNNLQADAELLGSTPSWLQSVITLFAPPLVVFLSGYKAPHTPRPDLANADEVNNPRQI